MSTPTVAPTTAAVAILAANAGVLPAGQKVYTFEHWTRFIGYQAVNVALTALWVCLGVLTANPFLVIASSINGLVQAGLILADWSASKGKVSHASVMNAAVSGLSLGYLSQILKIGSTALSGLGIGTVAVIYGIQLCHLSQRK